MEIGYYVDVEPKGGADLGFGAIETQELAPDAIVVDPVRGASYVVIEAEVFSHVLDGETVRTGRVRARPVS